jgi:hypothetical protein
VVDVREGPEYEVDRKTYYKDNANITTNALPSKEIRPSFG